MGNPIQEYDLIPPTDKDRFLGIDWETGKTKTFQYEEIKAGMPASDNSFVDVTWVELVAITSREVGQKYNITTPNPDDSITYGKITLSTPNTFSYEHTPIDVETIIID